MTWCLYSKKIKKRYLISSPGTISKQMGLKWPMLESEIRSRSTLLQFLQPLPLECGGIVWGLVQPVFPGIPLKPSPEFPKKSQYTSTTVKSTVTSSSIYLYFVWYKSPTKTRMSELSAIQTSQRNSLCLKEFTVLTEGVPESVWGKERWKVICPVSFQRMSGGPQPLSVQEPVHCPPDRAGIDHFIVLDQTHFLAIRHLFVCVL